MPDHSLSCKDDSDELEARFEGWWSRLACEACGEVFEIEDDPHNGQEVECDACGATLKVVGR